MISIRTLALTTLIPGCLTLLGQAATITLYTPAIVEPSGGPQVASQAFGTNSILSVSAVDVLPGGITEYAEGLVVTIDSEVGSGTAKSVEPVVTTESFTFQEGASFIGNSFHFVEFTQSGTQTFPTPVTGVAGCTVTAPPSASETQYHCAQVQVIGGTSTVTFFYNATASPVFTLAESSPPPTASATTAVLFPSGVPTSASNAMRSDTPLRGVLLTLAICLGFVAI